MQRASGMHMVVRTWPRMLARQLYAAREDSG